MTQLSPQEKEKIRLHKQIRSCFEKAGFEYLHTDEVEKTFGQKTGDIDATFLYQNILILIEETVTAKSSDIKDHLRKKRDFANEINSNLSEVLSWLRRDYSSSFSKFCHYLDSSYKCFHLYSCPNLNDVSFKRDLYSPLINFSSETLNYFLSTSKAIEKSARYEIFGFLGLNHSDIGLISSSSNTQEIDAAIISPEESAGLPSGIRIVSFMMKAKDLLECGYVLRKDSWREDINVYQRVLDAKRIKTIRKFLAEKRSTFVNNIIVSLPSSTRFYNDRGTECLLEDIRSFSGYKMSIPKEYNTIGIIDGQHRIYAHFEGNDTLENEIEPLRNRLHLLVTGFVFDRDMNPKDRSVFESEMFININQKARPASSEVIQYVKMWQDSYDSIAIARQVLIALNSDKHSKLYNKFQLSSVSNAPIKTVTIISFALRYLVSIKDLNDENSLVYYYEQKQLLSSENEGTVEAADAYNNYITFAAQVLNTLFKTVYEIWRTDWEDEDSKVLSVASINGFIMALQKSLPRFGINDTNFYKERLERLEISFKKNTSEGDGFPYGPSQYRKFSVQIVDQCFTD